MFSSTVVDAPHVKCERMFVLTVVIVVNGFNLNLGASFCAGDFACCPVLRYTDLKCPILL